MLSESKLGAAKLLLHPLGFALTHYADSSKIGFVLEGTYAYFMAHMSKVMVVRKLNIVGYDMACIIIKI